jgi:hypothetical protein
MAQGINLRPFAAESHVQSQASRPVCRLDVGRVALGEVRSEKRGTRRG